MNTFKKLTSCAALGVGILVTGSTWCAQNSSPSIDREQLKRSIQIVENVLNTVRQQALSPVALTLAKRGEEGNPTVLYLRSSEGSRAEGIYLDGYGVIFEVSLPNFSEQRSVNWIVKNSTGAIPGRRMVRAPAGATPPPKSASSGSLVVETKSNPTPTALDTFSKLIDSYVRESQNKSKEIALRELFSKLREANLVPHLNIFESAFLDDGMESEAENPSVDESRSEVQRKNLQNAIMKAVADYGSSIPGLQPGEYITVFLKAPVPQDFSLFSPETRTSTVIRFSVRDLRDYKTGKLSYADLEIRTKIEEN